MEKIANFEWKITLKGHFDETLGADFFLFSETAFLEIHIPAKYQHKIMSINCFFLIVNSGLLCRHFLTSFRLSLECVDIFTYIACCDSRKEVRK